MKKIPNIYTFIKNNIKNIIQYKYNQDTISYKSWDNKNLPTCKEWRRVLHKIYIKSPSQYGGGNPVCSDNNTLAKVTNLTGVELLQITMFLIDYELISLESPHFWKITQKGIDVALQNEEIKRDKELKYWLIICAVISTLITFVHFILIIIGILP